MRLQAEIDEKNRQFLEQSHLQESDARIVVKNSKTESPFTSLGQSNSLLLEETESKVAETQFQVLRWKNSISAFGTVGLF